MVGEIGRAHHIRDKTTEQICGRREKKKRKLRDKSGHREPWTMAVNEGHGLKHGQATSLDLDLA